MIPSEYQEAASRTECPQINSLQRIQGKDVYPENPDNYPNQDTRFRMIRVNHAILGLTGEVGELAGALERVVYYGKEADWTNFKEEIGDCLWYIALLCNALKLDMGEVMAANIAKLAKRYPEKFTEYLAAEENRNREAERITLETRLPKIPQTILALQTNPEFQVRDDLAGGKEVVASGHIRVRVRSTGEICVITQHAPFLNITGAEELAACLVKACELVREQQYVTEAKATMERDNLTTYKELEAEGDFTTLLAPVEQDGHGFGHIADGSLTE